MKELALLLAQSHRGQQVNSVFGEGVNPRLRKFPHPGPSPKRERGRTGWETHPTEARPRLVYGAALVENLREYLLGIEGRPKYIVPAREGAAGTRRIRSSKPRRPSLTRRVTKRLRRWVVGRIEREDVRERMRGHRLVHPIRHGARVPRPRRDGDQRRLFEE